MKIRKGFVSNSSSSSFMCEVSGETMSGMDLCMSDIDMVRCDNDHYFFKQYLVGDREEALKTFVKEQIEKYPEVVNDWDFTDEDNIKDFAYKWEFDYYTPPELCPICTFEHAIDKDIVDYMYTFLTGFTREVVLEVIKREFNSYSEFKEAIKRED